MDKVGYRQLLRENPDFRRLWFGDISSFFGDWFNLIALYTSVQGISSTSLAIGMVVAAKTVPNFLVIPVAGPIVDRFDRRRLLIVADLIRAVLVLGLIASHHAGSLIGLYACTVAMVTCTGVAFPAKKSALPMLVPARLVGAANALSGGTWSIMLAFGAALGGVAVHYVGITASFGIDAVSFLVSASFFARLPALPAPAAEAGASTTFADGLRYLRRTPYVAALACLKPMMSFPNSVVLVAIPLYAAAFGGSDAPLYLGILYAVRGAGAATGSLGMRMVFGDDPRVLRRLILFGYACVFGALTLVAHASAFWMAALGFYFAALGSGGNWVYSGTLLQLDADRSYHGRIFSLEFGVSTLVLGGGGPLVGLVNDAGMPMPDVTQLWAAMALPPALLWLAVLVTMRRRGRARAEARLAAAYAAAAEEPMALARSRQYRYSRLIDGDSEDQV